MNKTCKICCIIVLTHFFTVFLYSQTSKYVLKFEENRYEFKTSDTSKTDTLIFSLQWNFRDFRLSKTDSLNISQLLNLYLQGKESIQVFYWDFEFNECSERLYKKRGNELFQFIINCNHLKNINMIVNYEIIDVNYETPLTFPYNIPLRTMMITNDDAPD
jgi:hypothetical protein